jgi:type II secretory ATPase GspE/PulE/Tfp pilus assembly ATPase PilB-like protein
VLAKYQVHQRKLRSQHEREDDSVPTLIHGQESLVKSRASVLKNQDNQEVNTVLAATPLKTQGFLQTLQPLETRNRYAQAPGSVLSQLPPHELMLEIFGRSLERNITQISLERQGNFGRVIWSRNNQSKVLLDRLPAPLFQGLMHELKRLTDVPVKPVEQPKKVEMLRLYQNAPVLLRLRFVPSQFGEQAAVQIFRGALLQQYQKSQMATLGKELMQIAGLLDQKLRQAAARSQINPEAIEALPLLQKNLAKMNRNISLIQEKQVKW